ncbi:MAG: sugar phosphate isomerase/epimerase [Pirellulaceae bacterium]|nr:sugar phosphate isomerase/epimerase [Pirellulaceae bacterium]
MECQPNRRTLLAQAAALGALAVGHRLAGGTELTPAIEHTAPPRRLLKTLKIGMVKASGGLTEKFRVAKAAGFDGIELDSPGFDVDEARRAIDATGLPVDGTVCSTHWNIRHTSPDPAIRARALQDLQTALRATHAVGGHTVLLVVGKGEDGLESEIWPRSIENISRCVPLCAELGVMIAIENVWNQFLYDHDGPNDQTAQKYVQYVDQFQSPWVGMQFDIGNHWKYGDPAQWIRTLGRRVVKLDIKGFSRAKNNWADITEDDIPWADVRQALDDIGFHGWVAAEVGGGDQQRLATVARQIDLALNISPPA